MAHRIEPFHRVANGRANESIPRGWAVVTVRLMRAHFSFFGVLLLLGAIGLGIYLYSSDIGRIEVSNGLRITREGDIYEPEFQLQALGVLALAAVSMLQFYTANQLARGRRNGLVLARLAMLVPLAGFPIGVFLLVLSSSAGTEDAGILDQVISELSLVVRIGAVVLIVQSLLAMWYALATLMPPVRRCCDAEAPLSNQFVRRIRIVGLVVWGVSVIGLAVLLGVVTDWLYEIPVPEPEPGELLYATSFDNFNSEWDLYPGRDSVSVARSEGVLAEYEVGFDPALADNTLVISYGAGISEQVIWSTLDRKFSDFDLRVTARPVEGAIEDMQYGVIFRYRDPDNFYLFRISADGYYALVKVEDGVQEEISAWGVTKAVDQGEVANVLRVVARDDAFRFFVNGNLMPLCLKGTNKTSMWTEPGVCFTDDLRYIYHDDTHKQGRIGLAAGTIFGSDVTVVFDDLVIVGPEPDVMTVSEIE